LVIDAPPLVSGGVKATLNSALPAVIPVIEGAEGTVAAMLAVSEGCVIV